MNDILTDGTFFKTIFPFLLSIGMILWVYCIWFLNKYDKNTNRLIMLLILNIYYVPFYLFRISKIKKEHRIIAISEDIFDAEFIEMTRNSILDTLKFWASKEKQLKFHGSENINMSEELFQQWDSLFRIDTKIIDEAFNETERKLLKTFDKTILTSFKKHGQKIPHIREFHETNDWKVLNKLAIKILKEIK